jgi:hypothetical protein
MRNFLGKRVVLAVLIVAALGLLAGGIAYASIPDSRGVIHGCYQNTSGTLRVIGTNPTVGGGKCSNGESALTWNQRGPTGPPGADGTNGTDGTRGPTGLTGKRGPSGADGTSGPGAMVTGSTGPDDVPAAAGIHYIGSSFVTTDFGTSTQVISVSGTLGNQVVHVRNAPGADGFWDFQLVLDGLPVDDCTIFDTETECTGSASAHQPVQPGDTLTVFAQDLGLQSSGTPASWAVTIN